MFQPTVSLGMPTQMLQQEQQPVQSFQEGGLATPLVAQYDFRNRRYQNPPSYAERTSPEYMQMQEARRRQAIDDADALARYPAPKSQFRQDVESLVPSLPTEERVRKNAEDFARIREARQNALQEQQTALEDYRKGSPGSAVGDYFRSLTPEELKARAEERAAAERKLEAEGARIGSTFTRSMDAVAAPRQGIPSLNVPSMLDRDRAEEPRMPTSAAERQTVEAPAPAAEAPARQKGTLELTLDGIKAERAADRRENALLALMQAGFAMAAGRSPNAISNIGAGGQAGIGAFAAMERASREDAASRRREAIQLNLAERQLEKDPETVKLFKSLGGGDLMKGFEVYNSDKKLQAATTIAKDITAPEEDRRAAAEYIRGQLMKARGGGSFSGFSATPVK
jgi:hypothetical protein